MYILLFCHAFNSLCEGLFIAGCHLLLLLYSRNESSVDEQVYTDMYLYVCMYINVHVIFKNKNVLFLVSSLLSFFYFILLSFAHFLFFLFLCVYHVRI